MGGGEDGAIEEKYDKVLLGKVYVGMWGGKPGHVSAWGNKVPRWSQLFSPTLMGAPFKGPECGYGRV